MANRKFLNDWRNKDSNLTKQLNLISIPSSSALSSLACTSFSLRSHLMNFTLSCAKTSQQVTSGTMSEFIHETEMIELEYKKTW